MYRSKHVKRLLVALLAVCLAAPAAAFADLGPREPCPMAMHDAHAPATDSERPCELPCDPAAMANDACGPCQSCKIGNTFHVPMWRHALAPEPAGKHPVSVPGSIAEHPPAPHWRPPITC